MVLNPELGSRHHKTLVASWTQLRRSTALIRCCSQAKLITTSDVADYCAQYGLARLPHTSAASKTGCMIPSDRAMQCMNTSLVFCQPFTPSVINQDLQGKDARTIQKAEHSLLVACSIREQCSIITYCSTALRGVLATAVDRWWQHKIAYRGGYDNM